MNSETIYHDIEQGSQEWHNLRLGKITGSSFYKLLGSKSAREKYLYDRASEIVTGARADSEDFSNVHMRRGIECEPIARDIYICHTFNDVKNIGLVQKGEYLACSPDGLVSHDGMIEIKVPDSNNFFKQKLEISAAGIESIPVEYYLQMQFNLYICDRQWCDYVLYNPKHAQVNEGIFIFKVSKNTMMQTRIAATIEQAMNELKELINRYHGIG